MSRSSAFAFAFAYIPNPSLTSRSCRGKLNPVELACSGDIAEEATEDAKSQSIELYIIHILYILEKRKMGSQGL